MGKRKEGVVQLEAWQLLTGNTNRAEQKLLEFQEIEATRSAADMLTLQNHTVNEEDFHELCVIRIEITHPEPPHNRFERDEQTPHSIEQYKKTCITGSQISMIVHLHADFARDRAMDG